MDPPSESHLLNRLRTRVLAALHTGRLAPGARLPSVRSVARDLDVNPRIAMALYRRLADEGLVEVRPRSGVYLAVHDSPSPRVLGETARWVAAEVAMGAWKRGIPFPDLPSFLKACLQPAALLCVCVDEIEDDRVAICREVSEDFGMEVRSVEPLEGGGVLVEDAVTTMAAAMAGADLIVVTAFHERDVRPLAEALDVPVIVTTMNPLAVEEVLALAEEGADLVFVVVHDAAGRRLREGFGLDVTVLTVDQLRAGVVLPKRGPLIFTPAAAAALGTLPPRSVVPDSPLISSATAERIAGWMVHLNLQRGAEALERSRD